MFQRILVPLDGSAQSNAALPLARTVALATGAAVTVMRVAVEGEVKAQVADELEGIRRELAGSVADVRGVVREGAPADEIVAEARDQPADLIVMRTHGRSGIGRAVLGSVTERVLSSSPVPLLLLRPRSRRITRLQTLLVPVDGSPGGTLALGIAVELAQRTSAALRLLQVVVPIPANLYGAFVLNGPLYVDPAWDTDAEAAARVYVDGLVKRLQKRVSASGEVRVGASVAESILAEAEQQSADLIVMSSEALTGAARALLGSVADAVVRSAHCPVLIIRRPAERT